MPGISAIAFNTDNIEVCCPTGCNQCGDVGCHLSGLPNYTNEDCCPNGIINSGKGNCADTKAAPCIISGETIV